MDPAIPPPARATVSQSRHGQGGHLVPPGRLQSATMGSESLPQIEVDRLQLGMYVVLDVGWRNHPFLRSSFLLSSAEQLQQLRELDLGTVRWRPDRSSTAPLPPASPTATEAPAVAVGDASTTPAPIPEPLRTAWIDGDPPTADEWQASSLRRVEDEYNDVASKHRSLLEQLLTAPEAAREIAEELAETLRDSVAECDQPAARLLSDRVGEQASGHEVGVSALALLLARDAGFSGDDLAELALAALLHDAGKASLPARVREDDGSLTGSDREAYRQHVALGVRLLSSMQLPPSVLRMVAEHHEHQDGSGFPGGLKGEQISPGSRVLAIANRYIDLVHPAQSGSALTPHQALQQMFTAEKSHFDAGLLARFIRIMGVYPPGTVVELSDHRLALVVAARPGAALAPRVQLLEDLDRNPPVPPLDMHAEAGLKIIRSVPLSELPPRQAARLGDLARAGIYVEPQTDPEWRAWGDSETEVQEL